MDNNIATPLSKAYTCIANFSQHPRDSHGICEAIGTEGGLVVADCSARCVFILSRAGNIRKVLTQCGQKPFKVWQRGITQS